jgi:hypothetical protein
MVMNWKGKARADDTNESNEESEGLNVSGGCCYDQVDESDADAVGIDDDIEDEAMLSRSQDSEQWPNFGNNGGFAYHFIQAIEALDTTDEARFWENRWNDAEGKSH